MDSSSAVLAPAPGEVKPSRRPPARRATWLLPLLVTVAFLGMSAAAAPTLRFHNDSYRYTRMTLELLGHSPADAHRVALRAYCTAEAGRSQQAAERHPTRMRNTVAPAALAACLATGRHGLYPTDPRYAAIFAPRLGYPASAAPLVALIGPGVGMWLTATLWTALGGLLAFLLLHLLGAPGWAAAGAQALFYATPIGYWGTWTLAEGPANTLTMAALVGAWLLLTARVLPGAALVTTALSVGAAVKYSTFLLVAAALFGAACAILVLVRHARHRGTATLALLAAGFTLAVAAAARLRGWPSTAESLQDTFTDHYTRPDVADPWHRLGELNLHYWQQWTQQQLAQPVLLIGLAIAAWALWRRSRTLAALVLSVAATGVVTEVAHPVAAQGDRLIAPVWIAVVVGVPLALHRLEHRRQP